jgi:Flp pilus assembly protein TadG
MTALYKAIGRGRRLWNDKAGVAGIELALAAPMLVLLMTAGYDFGMMLFEQHRLTAAARAGVQYGIQSSSTWTDTTDITAAVRADAGDTTSSLTVTPTTCTCPGGTSPCSTAAACSGSAVSGTYVKVTVSESYTTLVTYPFLGSPVTITGQALIRIE